MDVQETKSDAKVEFVSMVSDLMPAGNPAFLSMIKYPMVKNLITEHGKKTMLKVIFLLIRDFCNSINVVRNMNEDQIIEAASVLIDECDNFRLEDYTMMFSMAKRGGLVRILDRIDISIITQILDEYWKRRYQLAIKLQESETLQGLGPSSRLIDNLHPLDAKISNSINNLAITFGDLKSKMMEWKEVNKEELIENKQPK